ncbi:MAG TPA: helix-hairpin-helix domain-containing protein [Pyrinomonadaceae bacterium]|nr:helix-hairpin-helix domain-containing protein [Pyrinomonadaceae bacterium]
MKFLSSPTTKLIIGLLSFAALGLSSACVKRQRESSLSNQLPTRAAPPNQVPSETPTPRRININTASAEELEKLPGIGRGFAQRILEHREKWGAFRRPEHLIMVRGLSDKRFRALRDLITVE